LRKEPSSVCYSAQIWADYRKYTRLFGAEMSIRDCIDVFWRRTVDGKVKIPKGMEAPFLGPVSDAEFDVKKLIDQGFRTVRAPDCSYVCSSGLRAIFNSAFGLPTCRRRGG
jgi:hypothetical protein